MQRLTSERPESNTQRFATIHSDLQRHKKIFIFLQNYVNFIILTTYILVDLDEMETLAMLLTIPETADTLRVSDCTVRRLIADRTLGAIRIGGQWRIDSAMVARFLRNGTTSGEKRKRSEAKSL